jgi:hypothetical protein
VTGNVPISLVTEIQLFDTIITRFDGNQCWFESRDTRRHPRYATYLRAALSEVKESLDIEGLTPEERLLYLEAFQRSKIAIEEANRDKNEDRIKSALQHAGAMFRSYQDRGDTYTVEYLVEGNRYTSVVDKRDLTVRAAGICLNGGDRSFDLTSLVHVIREGENRDRIVRVGINREPTEDPEDEDW